MPEKTYFDLSEEDKKCISDRSADFSNFCQKFKEKWWKKDCHIEKADGTPFILKNNIPESVLDDLALIAFDLLKKDCSVCKEFPMSVSEWKNIGIERGYWNYFKEEILKENK